jgi:hypothetical protein
MKKVLKKNGFVYMEVVDDPGDGEVCQCAYQSNLMKII